MAAAPVFAATPRYSCAQATVANTNRDGTGTVVTVFTAGASGSRIDYVEIKAQVTTTLGTCRLFIYDGSNYRLLREIVMSAITISAGVAGFEAVVTLNRVLPSGHSLRACCEKGEATNIHAFGGDF